MAEGRWYRCWWCEKPFQVLRKKNKHEQTCSKRPKEGFPKAPQRNR